MAGRRSTKAAPPSGLNIALMLLAAVLLVIVLALGSRLLTRLAQQVAAAEQATRQETEDPEEVVTVGGQQVTVDRELPQSDLEAEHFTRQEDGTILYDGAAKYGIDVSAHQGEIDWTAVAGAGTDFAILRIGYRGYSEGALNLDKYFEANYEGAKANGLEVGVYFFSQAVDEVEAIEEGKQVLKWLNDREIDCYVVFDWEYITHDMARTEQVTGEEVTQFARLFCREIRNGGYEPMIYCNGMLGYLGYDLNELTEVPVWYAEYGDWPSYAYAHTIWQYTDTGKISGIQGNVDRNIWFQAGDG